MFKKFLILVIIIILLGSAYFIFLLNFNSKKENKSPEAVSDSLSVFGDLYQKCLAERNKYYSSKNFYESQNCAKEMGGKSCDAIEQRLKELKDGKQELDSDKFLENTYSVCCQKGIEKTVETECYKNIQTEEGRNIINYFLEREKSISKDMPQFDPQASEAELNKAEEQARPREDGLVFENKKFSIKMPGKFINMNDLIIPVEKDSFYQIIYRLYSEGKELNQEELLQWERKNIAGACNESKFCGKIISSENVAINGVRGVKFLVQYSEGGVSEYHYSFMNANDHLRLWVSANDNEDLEKIEKGFSQIIDTLKFK